jgi:hypothetical protein
MRIARRYFIKLAGGTAAALPVLRPLAARAQQGMPVIGAELVKKRADAFLVSPDGLFFTRHVQLLTLAARHAVLRSTFAASLPPPAG